MTNAIILEELGAADATLALAMASLRAPTAHRRQSSGVRQADSIQIAQPAYDISKAKKIFGWQPQYSFEDLLIDYKTENVVAAKQAGVSNYIVKPFNAETLKGKIEMVLSHA